MCGIAGTLTSDCERPIGVDALTAMADAVRHRGPDAEGIWCAAGIGLAHRRLSIIDLAGGEQPMANEDGSVRVVFNGEIYNFRMLRKDLQRKGHRFRSSSDTEVLVHLYEEYGEALVDHLRGMFAFAIWDSKRRRLLLARDRVGLKPLYYYHDANHFVFGSEIKAILAWPGLGLDIDPLAVADYLTYGFIPGERSIYRQVRKLPPGHVLSIDASRFEATAKRYWTLNVEANDDRSADEWIEALNAKFAETVDAHRIADVPVGAFLSGGIDSSAIVAQMAAGGEQLRTFSIGFDEARFNELPHARAVAERYGTRHREEVVTPQAAQSLDDLVRFYDEPFADASAIPTMHVSRVARQSVKVVLSGDGGDEAFGGYTRYAHDAAEARWRGLIPAFLRRSIVKHAAKIWPQADWLPRVLRAKSTLTNLSLDPAAAYANTMSLCRRPLRERLLAADLRKRLNGYRPEDIIERRYPGGADPLRAMTRCDIGVVLPDDFLTKVDRASMSVGLEVRPPLVDHEFLELAASVPSKWKIRDGQTKWIFKQLVGDRLPKGIVNRGKQGFEIPVDNWLRGPLRGPFEEYVLNRSSRISDLIDQQAAGRLYRAHFNRVGRHGNLLWSLLVLGRWLEEYRGSSPERSKAESQMPQHNIGSSSSVSLTS